MKIKNDHNSIIHMALWFKINQFCAVGADIRLIHKYECAREFVYNCPLKIVSIDTGRF